MNCKLLLPLLLLSVGSVSANENYKNSLDCLTEAIYFESRSESFAGQLAVAWVIKNRVEDSRWPDSYCGVVHQKWQFSYYFDGLPEVYNDKKAKNSARHVAELVYYGTQLDFTEGANHYHTTNIRPSWNWSKLEVVMVVDNHMFYRDK